MMSLKLKMGFNPIIVKELRSRMRGGRAFATLTGALLLLGLVSYGLYRVVLAANRYSGSPVSPLVGQTLFAGLVFLELMIVCGVAPALTASAISGEQEKQTYDMLLATPLRPSSILWGKLVSALSYVFLIIFAAIPMASLVFIFGGVSPRDMLKSLLVLLAVAVMLGVLGLFMSALFRRSGRATVASYLTVVLLLFGPLFISIALLVIRQGQLPRWILVPSPLNALSSTLSSVTASDGPFSVFAMIFQYFGGFPFGMGERAVSTVSIPRPLYHYSLPLYGFITLVLYLLATRLVQPAHRWRIAWKDALLAMLLLLAYSGAVAAAFFASAGRYEGTNLFASVNPTPAPLGGVSMAVEAVAPPPTPVQDPNQNSAAIYAAVVRYLLSGEAPFYEGMAEPPKVWLIRATDDSVGNPEAEISDSQALPVEVLTAMVDRLSDIPVTLTWVGDSSQVPLEGKNDAVKGSGAILRVGNIHQESDTQVVVSASLYRSSDNASGDTYQLEKTDEGWKVAGIWTP